METSTIPTVTDLSEGLIEAYETFGYENRPLGYKELYKMLTDHGITCVTSQDKYLVAVDEECGQATVNDWTLFDVLAFLGY